MMHFPPVSDFPLFSTNFLTFWKMSKIFPFPEKNSHFHPPKFLTTFFSHRPQISDFPPTFPVSVHFRPDFAKIYYFSKCPTLFSKNSTAFYILYVYFSPPFLSVVYLCRAHCAYCTLLRMHMCYYVI